MDPCGTRGVVFVAARNAAVDRHHQLAARVPRIHRQHRLHGAVRRHLRLALALLRYWGIRHREFKIDQLPIAQVQVASSRIHHHFEVFPLQRPCRQPDTAFSVRRIHLVLYRV